MSEYSVVEAKAHLSRLIDRALAGESVTITRRGKPAVTLSAAAGAAAPTERSRQAGETLRQWFDRIRIKPAGGPIDSTALIRQMRDEGP